MRRPINANSPEWYASVLYREDGKTPFYVGMGCRDRWLHHEREAQRSDTYKNRVIRKIQALGIAVPRAKVAENLMRDQACALEVGLIAKYGRFPEGILTNRTAGGEGLVDPSEEVRKNLSEKRKGRKLSEEHKNKIGMSHKGRVKSPQECKNISEAQKGHTLSAESRAKMSATKRAKFAAKRGQENLSFDSEKEDA